MKFSSFIQLPVLLASTLLAPFPLAAAEHTSNWAVLVGTSVETAAETPQAAVDVDAVATPGEKEDDVCIARK